MRISGQDRALGVELSLTLDGAPVRLDAVRYQRLLIVISDSIDRPSSLDTPFARRLGASISDRQLSEGAPVITNGPSSSMASSATDR